jgi:uracil-DNA glycosylase
MHDFDPGYCKAPYDGLCRNYPDESIYPPRDFRTEWGPVFHRGRLDGTARVLVIGQDPAQSETIARRILVGVAGHRFQGFLFKLGVDRSYTMINTFLYSVYGQTGGTKHQNDAGIVAYRNEWVDAILSSNNIEAVIALGTLADAAWTAWKKTIKGFSPAYAHITHPTQPEGASKGNVAKEAQLMKQMLQNWNAALTALKPQIQHPDSVRALIPYGDTIQPGEMVEIPEGDLPAGSPAWMRGSHPWAARTGASAALKRATIAVTVPTAFRK